MFLAIRDSAVFIPFYCTVSRDIRAAALARKSRHPPTAAIGPRERMFSLCSMLIRENLQGNSRQARVGDTYGQERKLRAGNSRRSAAEYAGKNRVDVPQVLLRIEELAQLAFAQVSAKVRVLGEQRKEIA